MLRNAGIVQDWINEGFNQGFNQGVEKGKFQGEVATLQGGIIDVLTERFGVLKKGLSQKLAEINDPAVLRSLLRKSRPRQSPLTKNDPVVLFGFEVLLPGPHQFLAQPFQSLP